MALQPPLNANAGERMSQLLPTVKCSTCAQPVPLSSLGEHVCAPMPPPTPKASNLLAKIRQASLSISIPGGNPKDGAGVATRSASGSRRSKTPQPTPSPAVVVPPPKSATPAPGMFGRYSSSSFSRSSMSTPRMSTASAQGSPLGRMSGTPPPRTGTPGGYPFPPQPPPSSVPSDGIPRSMTPGSSGRRPSVSSMSMSLGDFRARTPSAPERPSFSGPRSSGPISPPVRPSMDGNPPRMSTSTDRPGSTRPSLDARSNSSRPSFDGRPSYDGTRVPSPLSPNSIRGPMSPGPQTPMSAQPTVNGEVNMAGVGRRGFQAVAEAAFLSVSLNNNRHPELDRMLEPIAGMGGRRENAPRHLDINTSGMQPCESSRLLIGTLVDR